MVNSFVGDIGDNWEVVCTKPGQVYWERGVDFQLKHVETGKFLFTAGASKFDKQNCGAQCPIMGQQEVSAAPKKTDPKTVWVTGQGIYFPSERARAAIDLEIDSEL
jgi:hypothetical protein